MHFVEYWVLCCLCPKICNNAKTDGDNANMLMFTWYYHGHLCQVDLQQRGL